MQKIESMVEQELLRITFEEVDEHPYFPNCNEFDGENNLNCFYGELKKHLLSDLETSSIKIENKQQALLQIHINQLGEISLMGLDLALKDSTEFQNLLEKQIQKMPKIFPAQKRGLLVNSVYEIPIELKPIN